MTEIPSYVPDQEPKPDKLGQELFRDYYLSYKHSQGSSELQSLIYQYLAQELKEERPDLNTGDIQKLKEQGYDSVDKLQMPRGHQEQSEEIIKESANKEWAKFMSTVETIYSLESKPKNENLLTAFLLEGVARRDVSYLKDISGRPGDKKSPQESYESYLRTYVLGGQPTKSARLDRMYAGLKKLMQETGLDRPKMKREGYETKVSALKIDSLGNSLKEKIDELVLWWIRRHPGEHFFEAETPA